MVGQSDVASDRGSCACSCDSRATEQLALGAGKNPGSSNFRSGRKSCRPGCPSLGKGGQGAFDAVEVKGESVGVWIELPSLAPQQLRPGTMVGSNSISHNDPCSPRYQPSTLQPQHSLADTTSTLLTLVASAAHIRLNSPFTSSVRCQLASDNLDYFSRLHHYSLFFVFALVSHSSGLQHTERLWP